MKADLPWRLIAFGHASDATDGRDAGGALRSLAAAVEFASVVPIGGARDAWLFRAAAAHPVGADVLAAIDTLFGLDGARVLRYDDPARGAARRVRVAEGRLAAVRLTGDATGEAWLREWLIAGRDVDALGTRLLVASATPPGGRPLRGRIVCNCFDVAEAEIVARLANIAATPDAALADVQAHLKCGTNCGSCLPEIKRLAAGSRQAA